MIFTQEICIEISGQIKIVSGKKMIVFILWISNFVTALVFKLFFVFVTDSMHKVFSTSQSYGQTKKGIGWYCVVLCSSQQSSKTVFNTNNKIQCAKILQLIYISFNMCRAHTDSCKDLDMFFQSRWSELMLLQSVFVFLNNCNLVCKYYINFRKLHNLHYVAICHK